MIYWRIQLNTGKYSIIQKKAGEEEDKNREHKKGIEKKKESFCNKPTVQMVGVAAKS